MMSTLDFYYKQVIFYHVLHREKLFFKADNLVIEDENKKVKLQHSCHRTFILFIIGNISITTPLLKQAKKFGFPILILGMNFRLEAYFNNVADGNTLLRKKQYEMQRNFIISKELIRQKIANQHSLLKSLRYRSKRTNDCIEFLASSDVDNATNRQELMGIEGACSKTFFPIYFQNTNWLRREPRCKRDISNLLLDIGYTYLFNFVDAILSIYGFDVYCGVHHTFFYQRKSLVCDLIEPFRCIIELRLRKGYNLKQIEDSDFYEKNGEYSLSYAKQKKYTQLFVKDIMSHREEIFLYIQKYYRWFMKDKSILEFPVFKIDEGVK